MGRDSRFNKRKAKSAKGLQRRGAKRETYTKVLIVCEGEKTEPRYFQGLRNHYRLNSADIEVCGECGSDPNSVLQFAKKRYQQEKDAGDAFDKVYCVFDKDAHVNYAQTLIAIAKATPRNTFIAINSVPCFEYWLLLHYDYSTRPYTALPGNSAGNQALLDLKRHLPIYAKGTDNIFALLLDKLELAKIHAERALRAAEASGTDNPTTRVHELVSFLQGIKTPA